MTTFVMSGDTRQIALSRFAVTFDPTDIRLFAMCVYAVAPTADAADDGVLRLIFRFSGRLPCISCYGRGVEPRSKIRDSVMPVERAGQKFASDRAERRFCFFIVLTLEKYLIERAFSLPPPLSLFITLFFSCRSSLSAKFSLSFDGDSEIRRWRGVGIN